MSYGLSLEGNFGWGGGRGVDGSRWGGVPGGSFDEFAKAVQAGYGTDHAALTGGGALRFESLDATLFAVTQQQNHFKLWSRLMKQKATATVDEWTRKPSVGGYPGSAFNSELGVIKERTSSYERKTGLVKYLMTRRAVSFVQMQQKTLIASEAEEQVSGTLELLSTVEHSSFHGDASVVSESFDGLKKLILADGLVIKDAAGGQMDPKDILNAAAEISGKDKWGQLTDMFHSNLVQADLDNDLDPSFRVQLAGGGADSVKYGAPVNAIRTSWGNIATHPDPFIREDMKIQSLDYPGQATSVDPTPPVSAVAAAAADATTKFTGVALGAYFWAVASVNKNGISTVVKSAQVTVAAGERVDITITDSAAIDETGYYVYRTNKGGTNADANFRFIGQIAYAGATTVFQDKNETVPGTSDVYLLNLGNSFGPPAVDYRQLLPMTKFALFPTDKPEVPWAQMLFLFLRLTKPEQCAIIRNVLPSNSSFKPYSA